MNAAELRTALAAAAGRFADSVIAGHDELEIHGSYVLTLEVDWQGSDYCEGRGKGEEPLFGATERVNIPRQLHERL